MNFNKTKLVNKNNRNSLNKPPKKSHIRHSGKNSESESSFTSIHQFGIKQFGNETSTPNQMIRGSFEVRSSADIFQGTAQTIGRNRDSNRDHFNPTFNATLDMRDCNMQELGNKGKLRTCQKLVPKGIPTSATQLMTMRGTHKNKLPLHSKRTKKKENVSTTFRKIGNKTVDSKGKLVSGRENKRNQNENNEPSNSSSGKKKSSTKKNKNKQSPKMKMYTNPSGKLYHNQKNKEYQNKVKFHSLTSNTSGSFIRKSDNF